MNTIKIGDKQPLPCPKCGVKWGYKVTQRIQKYVDVIYDEFGGYDGCLYSEQDKILHQIKRASCSECNTSLPFNVKD